MRGLSGPLLWVVRYVTGYRLYHLFALAGAVALALGAIAVPFWWLGEQAETAVGPLGVVIVALAYVCAAALTLALAAAVLGRLLLGRIRRLFA